VLDRVLAISVERSLHCFIHVEVIQVGVVVCFWKTQAFALWTGGIIQIRVVLLTLLYWLFLLHESVSFCVGSCNCDFDSFFLFFIFLNLFLYFLMLISWTIRLWITINISIKLLFLRFRLFFLLIRFFSLILSFIKRLLFLLFILYILFHLFTLILGHSLNFLIVQFILNPFISFEIII